MASVMVASVLIFTKLSVWSFTGSISVLASLVDSILDLAASLINMFAVRYSLRSPDPEHPFGHGKAEYLAGLGQALFVGCSALFIIYHAVQRFADPKPLECAGTGIIVMTLAIILTLGLVIYQHHVVERTGSTAIKADSLHYAADLLTNLGTLLALGLAWYGWSALDPLIAVGIALVVIYNAWQIGYESTQLLMDVQLPLEMEERISGIAMAHENVLGVHDIRTRRAGQVRIIQLHLEMARYISLAEAHQVAKEVEAEIRAAIPGADIIIHQDPV